MHEPDIVARALAFATRAHEGQRRKYTGEPYINHTMEVAVILAAGAGLDA